MPNTTSTPKTFKVYLSDRDGEAGRLVGRIRKPSGFRRIEKQLEGTLHHGLCIEDDAGNRYLAGETDITPWPEVRPGEDADSSKDYTIAAVNDFGRLVVLAEVRHFTL